MLNIEPQIETLESQTSINKLKAPSAYIEAQNALNIEKINFIKIVFVSISINIVLHRRDTKESTCLLWDITTEKSGFCCYAVRITQNTYVKK